MVSHVARWRIGSLFASAGILFAPPTYPILTAINDLGDVVGTTGNSMAIALSVGGAVVVETYWLPLVKVTLVPSVRVTVSRGPVVPIVVLALVSTLLTLTLSVGKIAWLKLWVKVTGSCVLAFVFWLLAWRTKASDVATSTAWPLMLFKL